MNGPCRTYASALLLAVCTFSQTAVADGFHYNNILIGDRAAGMGGSYTAISDDPSGLYYNPAGVVYATGSNLNGSMNAVHHTFIRYKDVLGGEDYTRSSKVLTPNFFGFTQPFGGGTLGFSYAVTDAILEDQNQNFRNLVIGTDVVDQYVINSNDQDTSYNLGPSYAYKISDSLSVGATLYLFYRHRKYIFNQQLYLGDGSVFWSNQYLEGTESGVTPILGLMWSPMDKMSVGVSVRKTQLFYADFRNQETTSTYDSAAHIVIPAPVIGTGDYKRDMPWQINTSVAYFLTERWLLSGEIDYFSAVEDRRWITNTSFGLEWYATSKWAVRTGLYSNLANTKEVQSNKSGQAEHVDLYGFSFSVTHFTRNNACTAGFNSSFGSGEAQILGGTEIQDVESTSLTVFLSTTYTY